MSKKRKKFQRVSNILIKYVAKQNPNIQVEKCVEAKIYYQAKPWHTSKRQLQGKKCWLRELCSLIVATMDEIRKLFMHYRNNSDECQFISKYFVNLPNFRLLFYGV